MQTIQEKKIPNNENTIIRNSRKCSNTNNHVHYYSSSSKKNQDVINIEIIIENKIKNEAKEELDHPKPLITENDEDLENLKSQFDKTEQKEIIVTPPTSEKAVIQKNDNSEKTKYSSEGRESNYEYKTGKNENIRIVSSDFKNYNNKRSSININKDNKCEGFNSINAEKNILQVMNKLSEYKRKNRKNNPFIQSSYNITNTNKTYDRIKNNCLVQDKYKNLEKEKQNIINSNEKENISYIYNQSNSLIRNRNNKNNKKILSSKAPFKAKIKTIEEKPVRRLVYQEDEKNDSSNKKFNRNPNYSNINIRLNHSIKNNSKKIIYKKLDLTMNNSISRNLSIDKVKVLNSKDDKNKTPLNKENTNKIQSSQKDLNEIKPYQQSYRPSNQKKINLNQIPNFNNTKTTYVVFSKNNKNKQIAKSSFNINSLFKENYSKIASRKNINNPKITLSEQLSFINSKNLFTQNQKRIIMNKSQKKILFFNKIRYDTDFRNSNRSLIYENSKDNSGNFKNKKPIFFIKNYANNKQKIFSSVRSNYDYEYYYGNNFVDTNCVPIEYNASYTGKLIY